MSVSSPKVSHEKIIEVVTNAIIEELDLENEVNLEATIEELGIDSLTFAELMITIESDLDVDEIELDTLLENENPSNMSIKELTNKLFASLGE